MRKRISNGRSRHPTTRKRLGRRAEQRALAYLQRRGLRLVTRNYRCRFGEIDLIMRDNDCIVFVEVRFRTSISFAPPALTVDTFKQSRIEKTAQSYLARHPRHADHPARFDVIAIDSADGAAGTIQWIRDAF
ncbi:MAG TPA: YraN family protein, partial [Gammaproteobacteria bacterium]